MTVRRARLNFSAVRRHDSLCDRKTDAVTAGLGIARPVRTGTNEAGTVITLADSDGNTVISHSPELAFQVIILSSPEIVSGESYTLTVGGESSEVKAS